MSVLDVLAQRLLAPLYGRRHGTYDPARIAPLGESQYLPEERLRARQWERLTELLTFAYANNSFYRARFEAAGCLPQDISSPERFSEFPILSKDDIRTAGDRLVSQGCSKKDLLWKRTGGSTGVPLQLYWDENARRFKHALVYRHDRWAGYVPGVRRAALWGNVKPPGGLRAKLYSALCSRTVVLDTLDMSEGRLESFVGRLRSFRPEILFGHGHSIFVLADFLKERGIEDIALRGIISTAEVLPPHERAVVEEVFGQIVFDRYGCEEVSLIASECEAHDGLHIAAEGLYVEILGGDEVTPGKLVVTDLVNRGMPFIRYEIGDMATTRPGPCACGRGLPRLGRILGRTTDLLYSPEGRAISGVSIMDTFTIHIPGLKQTQIIQDERDHLVFRVVRAPDFESGSLDALEAAVRQCFGERMRYDVEYVESIPLTERGKFRFTICRIEAPGRRQER